MGSRKLRVLDVGGGDGSRARQQFPDAYIRTLDIKTGWDVMKKGLPSGNWDIIFANHCIEHFSDPDFFLEECKRIMKPKTILEIGTPNLAAWYNRLLFLAGYVPNHMELSKKHNVGKPFDWGNVPLGGHIYVYTIYAIIELLRHYHFKVISVAGEVSTFKGPAPIMLVDKLLTKLSLSLASAVRIKCTI